MECPICLSKITKINRIVNCGYCDFQSCVKCNKEFFKTQMNARCMNTECKKEFTRNFLVTNFNKTYINTDYKTHLKEIYFQKEISKLPETICKLKSLNAHKQRKKEIKKLIRTIVPDTEEYEYYITLYYLYRYCEGLEHYIDIPNEPATLPDIHTYFNEMSASPTHKKYVPKYVGRCPVDNCKGFINNKYICELCSSIICEKCNVPLSTTTSTSPSTTPEEPPHVCDESVVSTIQLIKKDTKPCPTCHVSIYKIDGCDQMWCVECHTAFSWTTGEIEHKIHNPHYYEYLRNTNQQDKLVELNNGARGGGGGGGGGGECNPDEEEYDFLNQFVINTGRLIRHLSIYPTNYNDLKNFHNLYIGIERTIFHIEEVEIPIAFVINTTRILENLRISYALNNITDKVYKDRVHQIYKRNAYNEEITQVLQTFVIIIKDLLKIQVSKLAFEKETIQMDQIEQMRREFMDVYNWLDTKLEEISMLFNYTVICLAHDIYVPGCTIKSKSRVDPNLIGEPGFNITY